LVYSVTRREAIVQKADYYSNISELENDIKESKNTPENLASLQSRLDGLMYRFEGDESLGGDRYGLYQLQATISYFAGNYGKSKKFLDYAVMLNGTNTKTTESLYKHLMDEDYDTKSERIWWILIIAPVIGLVAIAIIQMFVHFVLTTTASQGNVSTTSPLTEALNILSVLGGVVFVVLFVFMPIWIIELSNTRKYNANHGYSKSLSRRNGILIAIFFGWWYWALYTYQIDKRKCWWNLLGIIVTVSYWGIVVWIWTIVNAVSRPEKFYALYPYYDPKHRS